MLAKQTGRQKKRRAKKENNTGREKRRGKGRDGEEGEQERGKINKQNADQKQEQLLWAAIGDALLLLLFSFSLLLCLFSLLLLLFVLLLLLFVFMLFMLLEGNAVRGLNVGLKMQNLKKEQEGAAHKGSRCPLTPLPPGRHVRWCGKCAGEGVGTELVSLFACEAHCQQV